MIVQIFDDKVKGKRISTGLGFFIMVDKNGFFNTETGIVPENGLEVGRLAKSLSLSFLKKYYQIKIEI